MRAEQLARPVRAEPHRGLLGREIATSVVSAWLDVPVAGASLKTEDGAVDAGPVDPVDFAEWIPTGFVRVAVTRHHGQWYATATDFDIAGVGPDEGAAYRNLIKLLTAYLRSYYDEGRPYVDAIRRSPRPLHLERFTFLSTPVRRFLRARLSWRPTRRLVLPPDLD